MHSNPEFEAHNIMSRTPYSVLRTRARMLCAHSVGAANWIGRTARYHLSQVSDHLPRCPWVLRTSHGWDNEGCSAGLACVGMLVHRDVTVVMKRDRLVRGMHPMFETYVRSMYSRTSTCACPLGGPLH